MATSETTTTQVIIIGAGPTGLSMAAQLLRHKVDFILLEKNQGITNLSKAIVVQARSLEIFRELGIVDEAMKRGQKTTAMNLYYKGERKVQVDLAGLGKGLSEFEFALSLEQSKTEDLLAETVLKQGGKIEWGSELQGFEQQEDRVTVTYKDSIGNEHRISADYLVGCDGAGSLVRKKLGLSFEGSTESKLFYVADVTLSSPVIKQNNLFMFMIRKGFVLFFPMEGENHYRIVGVLPDHDENSKKEYSFSEIGPSIKEQIAIPVNFEELRWFSTYHVHSRMADSFQSGRCFIAGDAAHIHTPAGGQGMNTGIQDSYNLGWKLAYYLRGDLNKTVLESYSTERTTNAKHLLQSTDRMFDIMSGVNPFWNFFRLNFFPLFMKSLASSRFAQKRVFPLISQIGISYPDSYLTSSGKMGKVRSGDRMPFFTFADGTSSFNYIQQPAFKIICIGNITVENDQLEALGFAIELIHFKEVPVSIFGDEKEFYMLLRPDNHISFIGKNREELLSFLQKLKD